MKKLKEIRTQRGMTQQEVAKQLNITQATYSGYESGKYEPNINILIAMSKLFQVSIDYLVGNENDFTIDMSDLSEIKKYILLHYLNLEDYYTYGEYESIRDAEEWEKENPDKADQMRLEAIEREEKRKEWIEYKLKQLARQEERDRQEEIERQKQIEEQKKKDKNKS